MDNDDDEALVDDDVPCEVAPTLRAAPPVVVSSVLTRAFPSPHAFSLAVIVEALIEQRRERPSVEERVSFLVPSTVVVGSWR